MKRMGELKVEIVDMERSLAGQDQSLVEDADAAGGSLSENKEFL